MQSGQNNSGQVSTGNDFDSFLLDQLVVPPGSENTDNAVGTLLTSTEYETNSGLPAEAPEEADLDDLMLLLGGGDALTEPQDTPGTSQDAVDVDVDETAGRQDFHPQPEPMDDQQNQSDVSSVLLIQNEPVAVADTAIGDDEEDTTPTPTPTPQVGITDASLRLPTDAGGALPWPGSARSRVPIRAEEVEREMTRRASVVQQQQQRMLLTDSDAKKAKRRKKQNREAAYRHRQRRKAEVKALEDNEEQLTRENAELQNEVDQLQKQRDQLRDSLNNHQCVWMSGKPPSE